MEEGGGGFIPSYPYITFLSLEKKYSSIGKGCKDYFIFFMLHKCLRGQDFLRDHVFCRGAVKEGRGGEGGSVLPSLHSLELLFFKSQIWGGDVLHPTPRPEKCVVVSLVLASFLAEITNF